jgi:nucleotidyltransferase/DNA polymerase involved in DNA repair
MNKKMKQLNVTTCNDLLTVPKLTLKNLFGPKNGEKLWEMCRGIDERKLKYGYLSFSYFLFLLSH